MILTPQMVVDRAMTEFNLPYIAKKTNSQLDDPMANPTFVKNGYGKFTKYARDLDAIHYYNGDKNGWDWCCIFVDWIFYQLAGCDKSISDTFKPYTIDGAGVGGVRAAYISVGRYDKTPRIGDQALVKLPKGSPDIAHTAIVIGVTDTTVRTVDGNTSRDINGVHYTSAVNTWTRTLDYYDGFGHPYYSNSELYTITVINTITHTTVIAPSSGESGDSIQVVVSPNSGYRFTNPPIIKINNVATTPTPSGKSYVCTFNINSNVTINIDGATQVDIVEVAFGNTEPSAESPDWVNIGQYLTKSPKFLGPGINTFSIWIRRKTGENTYELDPNNPYNVTQKIYKV